MTIRWFTDADREEMRIAKEEQRRVIELELAEARRQPPGPPGVPMTKDQLQKLANLTIDPTRRRQD